MTSNFSRIILASMAIILPKHTHADDTSLLTQNIINNSIEFVIENAFIPEIGTYVSELDESGLPTSDKVYIVALSRTLYALSLQMDSNAAYKEAAKGIVEFIDQHMIVKDDSGNKAFLMEWDPTTPDPTNSDSLHIWQQSYGFCGLAAFLKHSNDPLARSIIHELLPCYLEKYQDSSRNGFFSIYHRDSGPEQKTIQSIIYPISSFMVDLWEADLENRDSYESILTQQIELAYTVGWNGTEGWVNTTFDAHWTPIENPERQVNPGHNFQLAWTLLRAQNWPFIEDERKADYHALANEIIRTTLQKPIWADSKSVGNGFYEQVSASTDEVSSFNKSWWQHCEALIALKLGGEAFHNELVALLAFFAEHFVDWENGSEFPAIDRNNKPILPIQKGSQGKSAYHTCEMIHYLQIK